MPLKKDSLAKLLVRLGIFADEAAAIAKIDATEETDVAIPETGPKLFTDAELKTRDKAQYELGATAREEMLLKDIVQAELPDFAGNKKKKEEVVAALIGKGQTEGGKDTDQRIKDRDKTIATLRQNITQLDAEKAAEVAKIARTQLRSNILMWTIDKKPDHLEPEEWVDLLQSKNEIVSGDNGAFFVKRNGEFVTDTKLATNIPAKDALNAYIDERKWGKPAAAAGTGDGKGGAGGGRGAGDSKTHTAGIRTLKQYEKYCEENKIDIKSSLAQTELNRIATEVTDFDWKN